MSNYRMTHRWALALTLALPCAGSAQLSGEGLPDLSGIGGQISGALSPKATTPGGIFSSGLTVPSVNPGEAAKGIGRSLREKVEAQSGQQQPALQKLEDGMPSFLSQMESQLEKVGLAKRDLGVAVGYAFITDYEIANGKKVPQAASVTAGKTVALAVAKVWGPKFKTLPPATQESIYEKLLVAPMLLEALHDQFQKAGKTNEAQGMSQAAGSTFKTLFGASASEVTIDDNGKISGLAGGSAPITGGATSGGAGNKLSNRRPPKPVLPAGGLTAATTGGAKIFVRYHMTYGSGVEVRLEQLVLFPGGRAFNDVPDKPLPNFSEASLAKYLHPRDVGTWRQNGSNLTLTFNGKTTSYVKEASTGGWTEPDHKSGNFDVYYPIKLATKEQLVGKWKNKNLTTMGMMGGGAPMVAAGSNNDLTMNADGTFVKAGKSFASATTANMGDAFKTGGDTTVAGTGHHGAAGQWRIDGPLMTTVENGRRGVQVVFILPHWGKDTDSPEILIQGDRWSRPGRD